MVCNTLPAGQMWHVYILCVCLYESNDMFLFVLSHPNSGSFIRPTRLNLGRTFCEVVKEVNYLYRACSIFFLLLTFLHKIIFQFLLSCDTLKLPFSSSLCLWLFLFLPDWFPLFFLFFSPHLMFQALWYSWTTVEVWFTDSITGQYLGHESWFWFSCWSRDEHWISKVWLSKLH